MSNKIEESRLISKQTECGKISYYKNDKYVVKALSETQEIFEKDLIYNYLYSIVKNAKTIIDGGAHAGSHTVIYKHINPGVEVHSFEPQIELFNLLNKNIIDNNLQNVKTYNLALANKEIEISMATTVEEPTQGDTEEAILYKNISYGTDNIFSIGGLSFGVGGEKTMTCTLDSLELSSCDFIKLDIEGAEIFALHGAINTIKKFSPAIMFEYNHHQLGDEYYKMFQLEKETPFDFLKNLGYTIKDIGDNNFLATIEKN